MRIELNKFIYTSTIALLSLSCSKVINISPRSGALTSTQAFSTDAEATSIISGIYYHMINPTDFPFSNGGASILCGMSADELIPFDQTASSYYVEFLDNNLESRNPYILNSFWNYPYSIIYEANAAIEGIENSTTIHDSVKNELIGEAEFIRAFCNFYLTNLFGDIPLVTTTNWHKTGNLSRTKKSDVYNAIISDLLDAEKRLAKDYSVAKGQRIVPTKWAACSLLARVYLYLEDWSDAESQSTSVIDNTDLFSLNQNLNDVFLTNSSEAIWQLQQSDVYSNLATPEGYMLIPFDSTNSPFAYLTSQLLNSFEPLDQRRTFWVDSINYYGVKYYFPYKYKIGPAAPSGNGYSEYYMVLRLAEQYLIRAEARAQQSNDLSGSYNDLNAIRNRAGLPNTTASTKPELLDAIKRERKVELFSEWGHRWLDLKRWSTPSQVLSTSKGITVSNNALLYPIPVSELLTDPNLDQNSGY